MLKSFLIIINIHIFAFASQVVLVISPDSYANKAKLQRFYDGEKVGNVIDVNLGKNGLGVGLSDMAEHKSLNYSDEVDKKEGDKKAPLGIFKLSGVFGYEKSTKTKMPYVDAKKDLICVDDSSSKHYNKIIKMPQNKPKSFELMMRDDDQYKLGVVVDHNTKQKKDGGSCIFLHVQKDVDAPTAGCTSMSYQDMKDIVEWLDIKKDPILIQVSKKYLNEVKKLYPELDLD